MARVDAVIKRLNSALTALNPVYPDVYKRIVVRSGGDRLTGDGLVVKKLDKKLNPPPLLTQYRGTALPDNAVLLNGRKALVAEWTCTVSPTALSRTEVANPDLYIVFKDLSTEELFQIQGFSPTVLNGKDVLLSVFLHRVGGK